MVPLEQTKNLPEIRRYIRHLLEELLPDQQGAVVLREEIAVILQYLELRLPVEAIGGIHFGHLEVAVFNGGVLQADVHREGFLELQAIELGERAEFHSAGCSFCRKELMLRAEGEFTGYRYQVADGFEVVFLSHRLRNSDAVGVVDAQRVEHDDAVLVVDLFAYIVEQRYSFGDIRRALLEMGSQYRTVVGTEDVTAGIFPGEFPEHQHRRHLVLDGDFNVGPVFYQQFHHLVNQLDFGVVAVIQFDFILGAAAASR